MANGNVAIPTLPIVDSDPVRSPDSLTNLLFPQEAQKPQGPQLPPLNVPVKATVTPEGIGKYAATIVSGERNLAPKELPISQEGKALAEAISIGENLAGIHKPEVQNTEQLHQLPLQPVPIFDVSGAPSESIRQANEIRNKIAQGETPQQATLEEFVKFHPGEALPPGVSPINAIPPKQQVAAIATKKILASTAQSISQPNIQGSNFWNYIGLANEANKKPAIINLAQERAKQLLEQQAQEIANYRMATENINRTIPLGTYENPIPKILDIFNPPVHSLGKLPTLVPSIDSQLQGLDLNELNKNKIGVK